MYTVAGAELTGEADVTVAGGRIVYASDRYEGQQEPLPEISVEWSAVAHFGGYQQVRSGTAQARAFVEAASESAEQVAWREGCGEHVYDHVHSHGDGPLGGCDY